MLKKYEHLASMPPEILIKTLTYLPFDDVINFCGFTNSRIHDICTNKKYSYFWKNIITDTYGNLLEKYEHRYKNMKYDYITYASLIHLLDYNIQMKIYEKQGDVKSYDKVKKYNMLLILIDKLCH